MSATATVEPAATAAMEPAATMKFTTTMKPAARITAAITKSATPVVCIRAVAPAIIAAAVVAAAPVKTMSIIAVIPRPGADEDTARKPLRPIVTIRRARIGIISIVAVGACRCVAVTRADADANTDSNCSL